MTETRTLSDYPLQARDKLRYSDLDPMGHVNNAAFSTFLETGRVEMLHGTAGELARPGAGWVIARLGMDFLGEITWPGEVVTGTGVKRVGTSSVVLEQALFAGDRLAALAETVIVQLDQTTRTSAPLSDTARATFEGWALPA